MSTFRIIFAVLLLALAMPALADKSSAVISPADSTNALAVLEEMLTAYSQGQSHQAEAMVEPAMIGYQQLIDAMRLSISRQQQISIALHDTQMVAGDDVVAIHSRWDKRYLTLPEMVPVLRKGQTIFMMQITREGWKLAGQSGDNIFAP